MRPIAESIGEQIADTLAGALVPHPGWVNLIDTDSDVVRRRVDELARDPRLRDELGKIIVLAVRRRLGL